VSSTGIGGSIDAEEFWRIERFDGPAAVLEEITDAGQSKLLAVEQITAGACDGSVHREELKRSESGRELYYHLRDLQGCESVGTLAVEYIGGDVLFEVDRTRQRETWTVMMESEDGVGLFYDAIQVSLREGIRFEFGRIGQASERRTALFARKNLPAEQREARNAEDAQTRSRRVEFRRVVAGRKAQNRERIENEQAENPEGAPDPIGDSLGERLRFPLAHDGVAAATLPGEDEFHPGPV
jgi:hypothetical protein